MRDRWGALGGLLAVVLCTGCGIMPEQQARAEATDRVRAAALSFGTSVWAGLRETDAAGARRVLERHEALLGRFETANGPWENGVLAAWVDDKGSIRLDLAFRDKADAGGGLWAAHAVVMLCVRLTGTPGPAGEVRLTSLACPAALREPGLVDEVVTLAREGPPPTPERSRDPCHSGGGSDDCAGG